MIVTVSIIFTSAVIVTAAFMGFVLRRRGGLRALRRRTRARDVKTAAVIAQAWENVEQDPKFRIQRAILAVKAEQIRARAAELKEHNAKRKRAPVSR